MEKEMVKEYLLKNEYLQNFDNMFTALPFYIMSGRFPNLSVSEAADIVTEIRDEVIKKEETRLNELRDTFDRD